MTYTFSGEQLEEKAREIARKKYDEFYAWRTSKFPDDSIQTATWEQLAPAERNRKISDAQWYLTEVLAILTSGQPQQPRPLLEDVRKILLAMYELCAVRPKGTGPEVSRECVFCEAREDKNGKVNHYLSCHADRGKRLAEKLAEPTSGPQQEPSK